MSDDPDAPSAPDDAFARVPDDPAGSPAPGRQWRRAGAPLASALAAVVVIAGGVVAVHAYRGGFSGHPPVLRLASTAAYPLAMSGVVAGPVADAGREPASTGETAAAGSAAMPGAGRVVTDGPLPRGTGHGRVYRLPAKAASAAAVRRLAAALGLPGTPSRDATGWLLKDGDRTLRVSDSAGQVWTLSGPVRRLATVCGAPPRTGVAPCTTGPVTVPRQPGTAPRTLPRLPATAKTLPVPANPAGQRGRAGPAAPASAAPATGSPSSGPALVPAPTAPKTAAVPVPPAPAEAAVRSAATPVLAALGRSGGQLTVQRWPGMASVSVSPQVGGLPTVGAETRLDYDGKARLIGGSGWLATPVAGAQYPLVSAADALARLALPAPRIPLFGCPSGAAQRCVTPVTPVTPVVPPVVVTGAHRGLLLSWEVGGTALLVPAWLYDVRGSTAPLPVVAVAPAYLRSPAVGPGSGIQVGAGRLVLPEAPTGPAGPAAAGETAPAPAPPR